MSGADRLEDGFPHGTTQGYEQGCRGGWCPEGNAHGLSCKRAKQLAAGDYRYQRLVKQDLTPGQIADQLGLAPETHQPPKRKPAVQEDDTDDVVDVEPEEPTMSTITQKPTPAEKPKAKKPAPKPAPPKKPAQQRDTVETTAQYEKRRRDEARAWARENGVNIGSRGRLPDQVAYAFLKQDASLLPGGRQETPAEAPEPAELTDEPQETGTPEDEAHAVGEDGLASVFVGEVAIDWTQVGLTAVGADISIQADPQQAVDIMALIRERDTAEAALALTLRKWDESVRELRGERVATRVMRASLNMHTRLLESASAREETNEQILDDYANEIRRNHDEIRRLRTENEQLKAQQPWWKRVAS
ncbi:Lsr2 family protein [Microbacterium sp. 77mftsu3.1]|uniref:Lsr2 family DNA-binding protein n=1 Tax=Microbacterium sp. 77mftsu3.1 TaxID=1761802 RepID=UPI00036687E9|nr:Lsr2 family protein [Microbacterium sp. 77mftsu3.1]SDG22638.1 Lsr2 protein [Microbacterium sp. 77mftsu3.1]